MSLPLRCCCVCWSCMELARVHFEVHMLPTCQLLLQSVSLPTQVYRCTWHMHVFIQSVNGACALDCVDAASITACYLVVSPSNKASEGLHGLAPTWAHQGLVPHQQCTCIQLRAQTRVLVSCPMHMQQQRLAECMQLRSGQQTVIMTTS